MSGSDSVERLAFAVQLKRLVLAPPSKLLAHHDVYIKWSRGKHVKGKFHPVHCSSSLSHKSAGVPLMDIELPMTHQIAFDVNMRAKTSADGDTMIEKKTLDIVVNLFRYTDHRREVLKSRSVAASVEVDIRSLLEDMRVGIAKSASLPLSEHEYLECEYVVSTPVGPSSSGSGSPQQGAAKKNSLKALIVDDDGDQTAVDEPIDFPFVPVPVAAGREDNNIAVADEVLKAAVDHESRERGGVGMTALSTLVEEGLFKAVTCKFPVDLLFDRLFSDKHGSFAVILHNARGDAEYADVNLVPTASSSPVSSQHGASATKAVKYRMRIAKDNYVDGLELSAVCAVGRDVMIHAVNFAPEAPIVGSDVRLEILLHLTPGPGPEESTVAMYAYAFVASSKIRFMFGSKIKQQVERLLYIMEEVVRQIIRTKLCRSNINSSGSPAANSSSNRGSLRFRNSLRNNNSISSAPQVQSSLDPNLWRRLTDEHTLPHADIILPILQRLVKMNVARLSDMHIEAVENVIGSHRTNAKVVTAACSVLVHLCRACSPAVVACCSQTLGATLRRVFALHPSGVFAGFEQFLTQVEAQIRAGKEKKRDDIAAERNYWHTLSTNLGVADIVEVVLEKMAGAGPTRVVAQVTSEEHLSLLSAAISLHLGSERVVTGVFRMVDRLPSLDLVTPSLCLAMGEAYKRHLSLVVIFRQLMERIEAHEKSFTKFEKLFGKAVNSEKLLFSCNVIVNAPLLKAVTMSMTKNFLCIGRQVLPLAELRKVVPYRSFLRPAVTLVFVATIDDYDMIVFSRDEFFNKLRDGGYGKLIQAEKV